MTTYQVTLAFNVPCYATIEVEAETRDAAIAWALQEADDYSFEPAWDLSEPGSNEDDEGKGNDTYRVVVVTGDELAASGNSFYP